MKYEFPEDFKFGAAVWAQGTEGAYLEDGKGLTVLEKYAIDNPLRMQQGIPPFDCLDWYHNPDECIELVASIGLTSFRTSILWARLMPDGEHVNKKAVEFYHKLFSGLKDKGIDVWCVLYWFDMPVLFEDKGGFSNRDIIPDFVKFADNCFKLFSDEVKIWYVYNEPIVDVSLKYLQDRSYPYEIDMQKAYQSVYNMIIAHAAVVEKFDLGHYEDSKIGSVLNLSKIYPRSQNKYDLEAAHRYDLLYNIVWTDSLLKGEFPEELISFLEENDILIERLSGDKEFIKKNTAKVLGVNHYYPIRVKAKENTPNPNAPTLPANFFDLYEMPGRKMNKDRGWEIYPDAMYDTVLELSQRYPEIEMYITENGMGVQDEKRFRNEAGQIQDDYRIEYISNYLVECHKLISEGVNLKGYHMWSFIDLWSPSNQFLNCYGLVEFDPFEKKTIGIKKSGDWYKKVIQNHGFEA